MKKRPQQQGFTLVELLVALSISTIMISVAFTQLLQSRQVFFMQDANARLEENARYALEVLSRNIKMAGYVDTGAANEDTEIPLGQFYNGDCNDGFTTCTNDGDDDLDESDYFAVWLNPSDDTTCSGVSAGVPAESTIINLFYIETDAGIGTLKCKSYTIDIVTLEPTFIPGSTQALIEGIDHMQVLYGLSDQGFISTRPKRYVSASLINGLGLPAAGSELKMPWASINSVRIVLLAGTGYNDGADVADARTYAMADAAPITPANAANASQNNRRKIFSSTIAINNASL